MILLENSGEVFRTSEKFSSAIKQYLCLSLLKNCTSSIPQAFALSCSIFLTLMAKFRHSLKAEIGVFFPMIMLKAIEAPQAPAGTPFGEHFHCLLVDVPYCTVKHGFLCAASMLCTVLLALCACVSRALACCSLLTIASTSACGCFTQQLHSAHMPAAATSPRPEDCSQSNSTLIA